MFRKWIAFTHTKWLGQWQASDTASVNVRVSLVLAIVIHLFHLCPVGSGMSSQSMNNECHPAFLLSQDERYTALAKMCTSQGSTHSKQQSLESTESCSTATVVQSRPQSWGSWGHGCLHPIALPGIWKEAEPPWTKSPDPWTKQGGLKVDFGGTHWNSSSWGFEESQVNVYADLSM